MVQGIGSGDRYAESRRNPAALENQEKSLENQEKSLKNQQQVLEAQQRTNQLHEEANRIRKQQLEAQQVANQLSSESIEVQKNLSQIQRQYYNEQIKIDSKMLKIAEEHAERERNVAFCRWCGRQMPFAQIIDYLDAELCSLQCKKMYRQHVIEESRLMHCECCGNDLVLEVVERDYDNVAIGTVVDPLNHSREIPVTFGDIKVLEQFEMQSAIATYWDKFKCCDSKCLTELLSKDEAVVDVCNRLLSCFEAHNIYDTAMQKIDGCCFEDAVALFDSIPQYSDAPEKSEKYRALIADYTALVKNCAAKVENIKAQINDILTASKEAVIVDKDIMRLESESESLQSIKDDFLKSVPAEHCQYAPIGNLLTSIKETEELIADIKENKQQSFESCFIVTAVVFFILFIIICVAKAL